MALALATPEAPPAVEPGPLWADVDRVLERAADLAVVRSHGLHLLEARRLRATGGRVPPSLAAEERMYGGMSLIAPLVLERVRRACAGDLLVFKGPEAAALYPEPWTRPFGDLDLLVADVPAARRALLRAGFEEVGDPRLYTDIHHVRPLRHPELPVPVELHVRPKWIHWSAGPEGAELLRAAVPARVGVEGVVALPAAHHALLLAVHSWAHEPLRRCLDLVDVAAVSEVVDPAEIEALARVWGVGRLWRSTSAAAAAMLGRRRLPFPLGLWGGNVVRARERTVLESHLEGWLSGFSGRSFPRALVAAPGAIVHDLRRDEEDSWSKKARRSGWALRNAGRPRSQHDRLLEKLGVGGPPPERRTRR